MSLNLILGIILFVVFFTCLFASNVPAEVKWEKPSGAVTVLLEHQSNRHLMVDTLLRAIRVPLVQAIVNPLILSSQPFKKLS